MTISRVSIGTVVESASATSITPSLPASLADGDYVIFVCTVPCTNTAAETTEPTQTITGWTKIAGQKFVNDTNAVSAWGRFKDSGWSTMPTVSTTHAVSRTAAISAAYRGVDSVTPLDVTAVFSGTTVGGTGGTSLAMTGVTIATAGAMLMSFCIIDSSTDVFSPTAPSGMTFLATTAGTADGTAGRALSLAEEVRASTGATGTRTWTHSSTVGHGGYVFALRPSVGVPMTFTGSVTGTGFLLRQTLKKFTASITAAGVNIKQAPKLFTGSSTPTGVAIKKMLKTFTGSSTSTGAFTGIKVVIKTFTASTTPAGAFIKVPLKLLASSITATGAIIKMAPKLFSGSSTAAGALIKKTNKAFTGSVTPTGFMSKMLARFFAGSITSTGVAVKTAVKAFAGSTTSSGALSRLPKKLLTGSATATGFLIRFVPKTFVGTIVTSGSNIKKMPKNFTGSVTPTGFFRKAFIRTFTGVITPVGNAIITFIGRLFGRPGEAVVTVTKQAEATVRIPNN